MEAAVRTPTAGRARVFLPGPGSTCQQIEASMAKPKPEYDDPATAEIAKKNQINNKAYYDEFCTDKLKPLPGGGTLEMEMTLVLRFTSANAGAGMVYFEGETDRAKFAAAAPVALSR